VAFERLNLGSHLVDSGHSLCQAFALSVSVSKGSRSSGLKWRSHINISLQTSGLAGHVITEAVFATKNHRQFPACGLVVDSAGKITSP
jgi:hypothetical protein